MKILKEEKLMKIFIAIHVIIEKNYQENTSFHNQVSQNINSG